MLSDHISDIPSTMFLYLTYSQNSYLLDTKKYQNPFKHASNATIHLCKRSNWINTHMGAQAAVIEWWSKTFAYSTIYNERITTYENP
jgi:hypothetical protein